VTNDDSKEENFGFFVNIFLDYWADKEGSRVSSLFCDWLVAISVNMEVQSLPPCCAFRECHLDCQSDWSAWHDLIVERCVSLAKFSKYGIEHSKKQCR